MAHVNYFVSGNILGLGSRCNGRKPRTIVPKRDDVVPKRDESLLGLNLVLSFTDKAF